MSLFFNTTRIEALEEEVTRLTEELEKRENDYRKLKQEFNRLEALSSLHIKPYKEAQINDYVSNKYRNIRRICDIAGDIMLFDVENGEISQVNGVFLEFARNQPKTLETVKRYMEQNNYI